MRSRSTNILQISVMFTGLMYMLFGILFFISPVLAGKILSVEPNREWLIQTHDAFVALFYLIARGLAPLLFVAGLSMVMPLYDPLKYRLMIYLYGVIFPLVSSIFFLLSAAADRYVSAFVLGGGFSIILICNFSALLLTKENARKGIE